MHTGSMEAACTAILDSKGLQTDCIKQWFPALAAHQKYLESFKMPFLGFKLFPIDANAAGRVQNHHPKITEVPLLNSKNRVNPVLCSCLRRKGHKQLPTFRNPVVRLRLSIC